MADQDVGSVLVCGLQQLFQIADDSQPVARLGAGIGDPKARAVIGTGAPTARDGPLLDHAPVGGEAEGAGLYAPLAGTWFGDKIGLTEPASAEKRRAFASARHNHWAAREVDQWLNAADQAQATGPLNPDWPVAVVMAGGNRRPLVGSGLRAQPAHQARQGSVDVVAGAGHATLLGVHYADAVVKAIGEVREAASR